MRSSSFPEISPRNCWPFSAAILRLPETPQKDYKYYLYEALGYYNLGQYRKSLPLLGEDDPAQPAQRPAPVCRRRHLLSGERYSDALLAAQQAVTWDPSFAEAHLLEEKPTSFWEITTRPPLLDRALELDPGLTEALFLKGSAFKNRKRIEEAADYFLEAIQSDESYVPAYLAPRPAVP